MNLRELREHFAALRLLYDRGDERDLSVGEALAHWRWPHSAASSRLALEVDRGPV